jgi:two-component system OmpR family sensor kinase
MRSLPIRLRLTFVFAAAMAMVLAAMGSFVFFRVGRALEASVDQGLRAQAFEAQSRVDRGRPFVERDIGEGTTYGQLIGSDGRVVASTPPSQRPFAAARVLAAARSGRSAYESTKLPGLRHEWRLLATPVRVHGRTEVLILTRSLEGREQTLHHLFRQFLIAGPIALLLTSLAGYALAALALRPVDAMRRRAQAVSASTPGRRLPVPRTGDELQRLATTLNDMLARLEAAFTHERRFVADASHELRTPLALLRTELELALRRPRSAQELEAALRAAAEDTERLSRLAEDLLLIARADQGRLPIRTEALDAAPLLRDAAERFDERARGQGRTLEVDATTLAINADPERLHQALANLVENAIVHGSGPVVLSAKSRKGLVELHVTDEGRGFPSAFLERAFDRFTRAEESRPSGGTGLGLAIVALIAAAHGGEAGATNRRGGGADVWIAVPAAAFAPRPSDVPEAVSPAPRA